MYYYGGRLFRPISSEGESDTTSETIFKYKQKDDLLTGTYAGGSVRFGQLIGTVNMAGRIDMRYHHMTVEGELVFGVCKSIPEEMENGKLRLHERWQWMSGDKSKGRTTLEEI